jgi:hypothetical protein
MMADYPKVVVVTLNWNGLSDTRECLESLLRCAYPNLSLVAVDNGSSGDDAEVLRREYGDRVHVIANERNLGYSKGIICGMRYALSQEAEYVLLVQNDMVVAQSLVEKLVEAALDDRRWGITVPTMLQYHDRDRIEATPERAGRLGIGVMKLAGGKLEGPVVECHWAAVGCMLITRKYIENTGIMQAMEPYFLYGDPVWYLLAFRHGLHLGYVPEARVWHKGSMSLKRMGPARLRWAMRDYVIMWYRFWRFGYFKGLRPPVLAMYLYWIFVRRPMDMPVIVLKNIGWGTLSAIARGFMDAIGSLLTTEKGEAGHKGKR